MAINLADRLSAITTDSAGTAHVVWVENTSLWHAVYNVNSGTWENAQAIAYVGNQSLTSLNLIANDKLIQPTSGESSATPAPGLVVVYQQGSANDSNLFYTAARYNSGGRTQWLATPQALTADSVGDLAPRAIAEANGTVFVVGQKVNVDSANNQAIREDTDLYYQSFTVNQSQFSGKVSLFAASVGGVNQSSSYNYLGRNLNAPAANYTVLSEGEANFLGNRPTYHGSGFNWNASNEFNINALSFILAKQLGKEADQVLKEMFGPRILSLSLQGSAGNNPEWSLFGGGDATNGRLLLNALATLGRKQRRDIGDNNRFDQRRRQGTGALSKDAKDGFDLSFTLSSLYSYGNSNSSSGGKSPLYVETGGALASFAGTIPLFGFDKIKGSPVNFNFGLFFNAGVALQWQVTPKDPATYSPLLAPYLDLSGNTDRLLIVDSFSNAVPSYSELTAGLALLSNLEAAFASIDKNSDVELESLLLGIPVTLGFEGTLEVPYVLKIFGSIGFFADGTFTLKKDGPSSITVGMPVNLTVSVLGLISGRVAAFITATQTWPESSGNNQTNLQSATNGVASVDGFLLTINLSQSLDPNTNLIPTEFTVTVTSPGGQVSTIPVFGVVVQTDAQTNTSQVVLRLEQEIPYTTLNDQQFSNVVVNYTGNQLGNFTSSPVAINSSNALIYTYNPTGGTGSSYAQTDQQITIAFNGELDTDILPSLDWFTVTASNNQAVNLVSIDINTKSIVLTLASGSTIAMGESYTVQYNPDLNSPNKLETANQEAIAAFTVSNTTPPTARGLINRTFASSANVQTQPVLSTLTSDFAQDSSPALALTSQGDILLAWSSDTPPITSISVLAEDGYLYLVFADNFKNDSASFPSNNQFTIQTSDGNTTNPTNVSLLQNTIILTIDNSVNFSQIVEVGYSLSNASLGSNLYLSDTTTSAEFWVPNFTSTVEFSSSIATAPIPLQGSVISKLITIPFNQTLTTTNNTPNGSQFQVVVNGNTANPINVTNVTVTDTSVTLTLETIVGQGQLVSVTYTPNSNGVNNLVSSASTPQTVQSFTTDNFLTTASSTGTVIKTAFSPFGDSEVSPITTIPGTSGINSDVVATLYTNTNTQTAQNIVAWVNIDSSALALKSIPGQNYNADEAELINTALSQSDIYYSVLGPDNQWSLAAPIVSNQAGQDQKVTLGAGPNGNLLAAWLNTQLDSNGNPNTTIQGATFDGTQWIELIIPDGQNSTINPNSFSELSISKVNGQPAIFWTESKPASYSNLVANENPLIYLRLAELSGTTAINQGQLFLAGDGTYGSGGYTLGEVGALTNTNTNTGDFNPAVLFNGGGVTINSPVAVPVQGFSVEFWFKLPTAGGLVSLANLAGVFNLYVLEETLTFALDNSSNSVITQTITSGNWHYLVGTYDPVKEILALYVDGQLVGGLENVVFANLPKSGTLTLAGSPGSVYLDEFAFYNSVLSHTPTSPRSGSPSSNLLSLTGSQLVDGVLGVNEIGTRYEARFFEPVTVGPETHYSVWDSNSISWQSPVSINPVDEVIPTILSAANNPIWDLVSAGPASNDNVQISPNGNPDTIFQFNLTGQQGSEIVGVSVTTANKQLWSLGTDSSENPLGGRQLGVVLAENVDTTTPQLGFISGDRLLNSLNPTSSFSHRVMGATETLTIFVDTEGTFPVSSATVNVYLQGVKDPVKFTSLSPLPNQGGPVSANALDYLGNQVLGIATVKEANDASLSLVDSGFVINTDNPAIAAVMASGFSNGALAYVAVGNRGYTSQGNSVKGSIQILFAGGNVLSLKSTLPLTTTDLSGNTDGVLITGITDGGNINNNVPMALVTGDLDGDGIDDLVIGNANYNGGTGCIYVIYGQYLNSLKGQNQTIELSNAIHWTSNQGVVIDGIDTGGGAGFSLAIGNFTGNGPQIAFGAPFAQNSSGVAVGKVYLVSPSNPSQLSPPIHTGSSFSLTNPQNPAQTVTVGETAGYSLGVSRRTTGGPLTFTNNANDDLFIGSSTYGVTINNQWVGKSALPSGNQGNYPDTTTIAAGAAHVFSQPTGQAFGKIATYTGPNVPAANGVGANYLAGAAIALGDFPDLDGDGQQDLAISALGVNGSAGAVYVLSGSKSVASSSAQALNEVSQLTINGGIAGGKAGITIMAPGDVNGDGYQDFLITAPQAGNGTGQSYLLFGPLDLSEVGQQFDLSTTGSDSKNIFLLNGSLPNQLAGTAVVSLGNITGKTGPKNRAIDSFIVSAPNAQQFYVVYGQPWLADDGSINLADVASDNGFVIDGNLLGNPPTIFETTSQYIDTTPAMLVNGTALYLAYKGFGGNNQIYVTASTNNGQSWDWEVQLPATAQTIFPPTIAFFNNVLYLSYVDSANQLYIATSQNWGQNWNEPFAIGGASSIPPTLVVYQGTLSLLFAADNDNSNILQFYLNSSNDWIYADAIGSNQTAISAISATVLGDTLYLAYKGGTIANPNPNDFLTSTNNPDLSASDWNSIPIPGVSSQGGPSLTNDGQNLYLSYVDTTSNQLNLVSSGNGSSWSPPQVISSGITQVPPAIAFANNELYLSYPGPQGSQELNVTSFPLPFTGTIVGNGNIVRLLGDVNGDGFADIFSGGTSAGAIVFGNSTQDLLTAASGSDDLVISVPNATLRDLISLGDFNGDGFMDFGVLDSNGNFSVIFGNISLGDLKTLSVTPGSSPVVIHQVGGVTKCMTIGDYSGDGYYDVLLWGDNGNQVAWGNATGSLNSFTNIDYPETQTSATGVDLNGDGYTEIAIGSDRREIVGQISTAGSFSLLPIPSIPLVINTLAGANQLQNIGDFNGDGIADLAVLASNYYAAAIGEPNNLPNYLSRPGNQGGVFIYYGTPQGLGSGGKPQPDVILAAPFTILAGQQSTFQLSTIAKTGDVNGDGFDDVLISSPFTLIQSATNSRDNQGSVFVVFGGNNWANTPFDLGLLSANQTNSSSAKGFLIDGLPNAQAGMAIGGGEDVNGDGFDDFIIGAPGETSLQYNQKSVFIENGTDYIDQKYGFVYYSDGNQAYSLGTGDQPWASQETWINQMAVQWGANGEPAQVVVALASGYIYYYNQNTSGWEQLNSPPKGYDATQLSVQWNDGENPNVVFSYKNGQIWYFQGAGNGGSWSEWGSLGSDVTQMAVQWGVSGEPAQIVVGLANGDVVYYNSQSGWQTLNKLGKSITQLSVQWKDSGNPNIVVGLDNSEVQYYQGSGNGGSWTQFHDNGWVYPVQEMAVQWISEDAQPLVVVGLGTDNGDNGTVWYYQGSGEQGGWTYLSGLPSGAAIAQMAVQWNVRPSPSSSNNVSSLNIVVGQADSTVSYYNGSGWIATPAIPTNLPNPPAPLNAMTVQWSANGPPQITVGLGDFGYQEGELWYLRNPNQSWQQIVGTSNYASPVTQIDSLWTESFVPNGQADNLSYVFFGSDFNQTVNQTGTIGDDVMLGSPTGESLLAGQGDDQIHTNGGLDVAYAGPGDDWVAVSDTFFRRLDGGTGFDILALHGYNGQDWDITTLSPGLRLQDFEAIDIRDYGANQLTLNSLTVNSLSSDNLLVVMMDEIGDSLQLSSDFTADAPVYQYGQRFYPHKSNDSAAIVLVNQSTAPSLHAIKQNKPAPIVSASKAAEDDGGDVTGSNYNLLDDSIPNAPTKLFVSNPIISEAKGKVDFVIERTGNVDKHVLFGYLTQDMDGKAGDRFLPVAGQAIFAPGETSKIITIEIPDDGVYTGDRHFGLLVSLLEEGLERGNWGHAFSLAGDANGAQIRHWEFLAGATDDGLMGGAINFSTTVTDGRASVHLNTNEIWEPNDFFSYNPITDNYESLILAGITGAKLSGFDSQNNRQRVELTLLDGDLGDADGVTNGLVKTNGYLGRSIPGLITNDNRVFWAPTRWDGQVQLRLINSPYQNYEMGWIPVDDSDGSVDGLHPNDAGYKAAALARKQTIFKNQSGASTQALTRTLAQQSLANADDLISTESQFFGNFANSKLEANRYYMLYSQEEENATFSINAPPTVVTDSRGYHQLGFNGITTEIGSSTILVPGILNQVVAVEALISRAAAFNNSIAFFKVDSLIGGIDTNGDRQIDLQPGDDDYAITALSRVLDPLTGVILNSPDGLFGTAQQTITLLGNTMYGVVIIPNATVDQVLSQNPANHLNHGPIALFSFGDANPDGFSHMARLGSNLFGFEDIVGGGDRDYNDMVVGLTWLQSS